MATMLLAHKIALDPNKAQREYFARASGVARFAYNWALAEWRTQYKAGGKPNDTSLRRQLNAIKREQFPWMFDVTKCAVQEAVIDLGAAFRAFFEKRGKYPHFKKKDGRASFCAANEVGTFRVDGRKVKLPVIGWVRMREEVRFSGVLKRATVSREADRWFVSLMIETDDIKPVAQPLDCVGVDLGVKALATLSTGEIIEGPKPHTDALKRLRRANKALSRKRRGSANFRKQKRRLARLHARIANIRRDATHKLTTRLTKTYRTIGVENLNVRGMAANGKVARAVMDGGFFEFRRQLEYKARMYGSRVVVADRWFPSSKTCSCCGVVKPMLALSQRMFNCDDCGFEADRDHNAALNLARMAASSAATACGEIRAGAVRKSRVKRASVKQEENTALKDAA
ncbi:transposase [Methylocystis sp. WRRC1]|uniref:RNA-guided endonuclease InsQ/TnpB family protein n=1 Tax=Methylocystis sp. WRRC1 TaxID=1732014 RepID=UPI001D151BA9|nr:transposase [Methylocystis sp. WRRC1]MCC3243817.1 transposase [Methylocystis sp. WRRC1]